MVKKLKWTIVTAMFYVENKPRGLKWCSAFDYLCNHKAEIPF